jgi:hypothetical protein
MGFLLDERNRSHLVGVRRADQDIELIPRNQIAHGKETGWARESVCLCRREHESVSGLELVPGSE